MQLRKSSYEMGKCNNLFCDSGLSQLHPIRSERPSVAGGKAEEFAARMRPGQRSICSIASRLEASSSSLSCRDAIERAGMMTCRIREAVSPIAPMRRFR